MKIKTYAQYKAIKAELEKALQLKSQGDDMKVHYPTKAEQASLATKAAAFQAVTPEQVSQMKKEHQRNKLEQKQNLESAVDSALTGVKETARLNATYKAATKAATGKFPEVDVKALASSDVALAIDSQLRSGFTERARKAGGLLAELTIGSVSSKDFKPSPVETTQAAVAKYEESGLVNGFTYTETGTSILAQAIPNDSGFQAVFTASNEAISDPLSNLVDLVGASVNKSMVEEMQAELATGDSSLDEFGGVFTDCLDATNSYAQALLDLDSRNPFMFAAVKSGVTNSLGSSNSADANYTLKNLKALQKALPSAYRKQSPVYVMNSDTFDSVEDLRTQESQAYIVITSDSIDGYRVVIDEDVPDNFVGFGLPNEALGVDIYSTSEFVNPYQVDGAVKFTRKLRAKQYVKANDAFVALIPVA